MDRVNGNNTVDIGDGRRGFRSQNAAAGIAGTEVTDKILNDVQEEICAVIEKAGFELDPANQQQLWEALQSIAAPGFANRVAWLPVISMTVTAPPNNAVLGDVYIIPAGATGAWAGSQQKLAEWTGSKWRVVNTKNGHGISLPDGRVFEKIGGAYVEKLAIDVQSGKWSYVAVVGGAANALTATLNPSIANYADIKGAQLRLLIAATNSGPATLNLNGLGARPIVTLRGADIARGDLPIGAVITVVVTDTAFMLAGIAYSEVPIISSPTIWVRTDGNDDNDGSANDSSHALATLDEAIRRSKYFSGFGATKIMLGSSGRYNAPSNTIQTTVPIAITGNTLEPDKITITGAGTVGPSVFHVSFGSVTVSGVTFENTGNLMHTVGASQVASLTLYGIRFTNTVASPGAHVISYDRSTISVNNSNHIGTAAYGWAAVGGTIIMGGNCQSSMGAQVAFAMASETGRISRASSALSWTNSGGTGSRYSATMNGVIAVGGGGANFFPGSSAGAVSTGGQYA